MWVRTSLANINLYAVKRMTACTRAVNPKISMGLWIGNIPNRSAIPMVLLWYREPTLYSLPFTDVPNAKPDVLTDQQRSLLFRLSVFEPRLSLKMPSTGSSRSPGHLGSPAFHTQRISICCVDAFASKPFEGNPAAVCVVSGRVGGFVLVGRDWLINSHTF
jgi:hypothetical protein